MNHFPGRNAWMTLRPLLADAPSCQQASAPTSRSPSGRSAPGRPAHVLPDSIPKHPDGNPCPRQVSRRVADLNSRRSRPAEAARPPRPLSRQLSRFPSLVPSSVVAPTSRANPRHARPPDSARADGPQVLARVGQIPPKCDVQWPCFGPPLLELAAFRWGYSVRDHFYNSRKPFQRQHLDLSTAVQLTRLPLARPQPAGQACSQARQDGGPPATRSGTSPPSKLQESTITACATRSTPFRLPAHGASFGAS